MYSPITLLGTPAHLVIHDLIISNQPLCGSSAMCKIFKYIFTFKIYQDYSILLLLSSTSDKVPHRDGSKSPATGPGEHVVLSGWLCVALSVSLAVSDTPPSQLRRASRDSSVQTPAHYV